MEGDQKEKNEGDAEDEYGNKEHLTRAIPLRALEETRWNSLSYNTIVQSHLMLSEFLGSQEFSNLLRFPMLSADWTECGVAMCRSYPQSIAGNKTMYINVQQSFEIVHARQELQLRIRKNTTVYKAALSIALFTKVNNLKYCTVDST